MKICFVTSECDPFVKTGGLADVSGSLPLALADLGLDVKVFLPLYSSIDRGKFQILPLNDIQGVAVKIGDKTVGFNLF